MVDQIALGPKLVFLQYVLFRTPTPSNSGIYSTNCSVLWSKTVCSSPMLSFSILSALQCPHLSIYPFTFIPLVVVLDFCVLYQQMSPFDGAPEEFDQTVFTVQTDRAIGPIEELALNLVKEQQR